MLKNFKLSLPTAPSLSSLKDPRFLIRVFLGILLAANLVTAGFAFHLFDESPERIAVEVQHTRQQVLAAVMKLNRTRTLAGKVDKGRDEGTRFISAYMTSRRETYSTVLGELDAIATQTGMKSKDALLGLDAIQGTDSLDVMTITASFEGPYPSLVKFVNLLDKSKRFLIIESLAATPQQNGNILQVTLKLNTFVKDDPGA
jgi:hypothetical protein